MSLLTDLPVWLSIPIAWLVLGLVGKMLFEAMDALVSIDGKKDFWFKGEKTFWERHLVTIAGGPFTLIFGTFMMIPDLKNLGVLFRRKPAEKKK